MNSKTYTFHVSGTHCSACKLLIESELEDLPHVKKTTVDLKRQNVTISADFHEKEEAAIAEELNNILKEHGYTVSLEKTLPTQSSLTDFKLAAPFALGFIALFIILQKLGLINLVQSDTVTYGTAFVIGIIASVSTCMAVVGGLVLSISANFAKGGDTIRPQIFFHIGRLVSFFILGGVIGMIGSTVAISPTVTVVLNILIALVLLVLGINLLDVFHWSKRMQVTMPSFLSKHMLEVKKINHSLTPVLIGAITFFLPCGFTQSMQFYTLTTGSFVEGAFTMFSFALGTLPVLAILSFTSLSISKNNLGIFFKTAGLVVVFFALLNIVSALTLAGIMPALFNL